MATITTLIGWSNNGQAMTLEEFQEAEFEEGYRYELARGVVEVTQVPNDPHGQVVSNLHEAFVKYKIAHPQWIRRIGGGGEFQLVLPGMVSGRNPDLAVVLQGAPKDHRGRRIPSLVAEVVSAHSSDRDYRVKREEYLAYGLLEYWIVDRIARRLTLLVRDGDIWVETVFDKNEQVIPSLILPGMAATLGDLWVDLDEADDDDVDP